MHGVDRGHARRLSRCVLGNVSTVESLGAAESERGNAPHGPGRWGAYFWPGDEAPAPRRDWSTHTSSRLAHYGSRGTGQRQGAEIPPDHAVDGEDTGDPETDSAFAAALDWVSTNGACEQAP